MSRWCPVFNVLIISAFIALFYLKSSIPSRDGFERRRVDKLFLSLGVCGESQISHLPVHIVSLCHKTTLSLSC